MRITIPQPQFLRHLQMVERAVNDRSTLPILANVLLETHGEELTLTATDLDVGIQCRFPLTRPSEPGAIALPARKLTTIVRELPDDEVVLEAKKNATATLHCGSSMFRVPGLHAEDFPVLPQTESPGHLSVSAQALRELIAKTAHAMSMEETRFVLNGALLATEANVLVMVATDGRRLAVARAPLQTSVSEPLRMIIPSKTIRELGRLLEQQEDTPVTIASLAERQLAFRFGRTAIITRLIEGQFPQYDNVIPPAATLGFTCRRHALIDALRRASLMTTANSQAVLFELSEGRLMVSKESAELGSAREELQATVTTPPMTVAFNPEFWLEVLKTMEGDEVSVELSGMDRPAVIRQPDFLYLVLPMKLT